MSTNKGIRHFRNLAPVNAAHRISNRGGVTMAFEAPKHIADLEPTDTVHVSFAFCSREDNFQRQTGAEQAAERLGEQTHTIGMLRDEFLALLHTPYIKDLLVPEITMNQFPAWRMRVKKALIKR